MQIDDPPPVMTQEAKDAPGRMHQMLASEDEMMTQQALYPRELHDLVAKLSYRTNWEFILVRRDRGQGCKGLTLAIYIEAADTYRPERMIHIVHYMIVPAAAYDRRSWQRWLFDQILLVERHEAAEFFQIDGFRPYAPHHGPGNDPYIVFEHGGDEGMRTSSAGQVRKTYDPEGKA